MKLSSLKIDGKKIMGGAWVKDIPVLPGIPLRVRGWRHPAYDEMVALLTAEVPVDQRANMTAEQRDEIRARAAARTLILDWASLEDDDGKPVPFSVAKAEELMTNPDMLPFRIGAEWAISNVLERGDHELKADVKNSSRPSRGKSAGGQN